MECTVLTKNAVLGTGSIVCIAPCPNSFIPDKPHGSLLQPRRPNRSPLGNEELPDPLFRGGAVTEQPLQHGLRERVPDSGLKLARGGDGLVEGERGGASFLYGAAHAAVGASKERPLGGVEVRRGGRKEGGDGEVGRRQRGGRVWQGGEEVEGVEGVSGDRVRGEAAEEDPAAEAQGRVGGKGERGQERVRRVGGDGGSPRTWSRIRVASVGVSRGMSAPVWGGGFEMEPPATANRWARFACLKHDAPFREGKGWKKWATVDPDGAAGWGGWERKASGESSRLALSPVRLRCAETRAPARTTLGERTTSPGATRPLRWRLVGVRWNGVFCSIYVSI
jgi:hypothetical protein